MPRRFVGKISWPRGELDLTGRTLVMGILNITPDSFSDGGLFYEHKSATEHGIKMIESGADIIDIGGESTRPGADSVEPDEQIRRILPVIKELSSLYPHVPISVDTTSSKVAKAAIEAGAGIVNDISALRFDPDMRKLVAEYNLPVVIMHMKGTPKDMQIAPYYDDTIKEIKDFLQRQIEYATEGGIEREKIIVDVGIGFGKRLEDNLVLIDKIEEFFDLGYPLLVGHSRKSFIGKALDLPVDQRDGITLAISGILAYKGVHILRVHNVEQTAKACNIIYKIKTASSLLPKGQ